MQRKSDKPRDYYNIKVLLGNSGYLVAADNETYIWAVLDYLEMMPNDYTIFDWLRDTEQNYPEDLRGEDDARFSYHDN